MVVKKGQNCVHVVIECPQVWKKPLQLLYSTLVSTQAPFFVEKTMSYVIIGNDRICPFFDKKKSKKCLLCQIDFLIICNFFVLTISWSGTKQRFCFSEIYYFKNPSGIPDLSLVHIMASGNFICLEYIKNHSKLRPGTVFLWNWLKPNLLKIHYLASFMDHCPCLITIDEHRKSHCSSRTTSI